jgi:diguanylate cyclase (GGDEF)-like protein/PAS domain S-box-containing protein
MLKLAEANLSALIESTHDLIWSVDLDYRLITFNKEMQQNIQNSYGARLVEGMCFHEVLPPERAVLWPQFYERVLAEGPFRVEYSRIDGGIMELAFNPIVVDGETTGISVFGKDITERKAAESALKEAEANLSALIESTQDLIWSVDLDHRLTAFNQALWRVIHDNYGIHAVAGMRPAELLPPERAALWDSLINRGLAEGPFRIEFPLLDGRILELSLNPIVVDGITTGVSVFGKDITERKQSIQALAESEDRFRRFFEENGSVMLLADPSDGEIVAANRAACAFYGYPQEQLVGMFTRQIDTLTPEELALDRQRALNKECSVFTYRGRLASGEERDIEVYSSPIAVGGRTLLCGIIHDVSERKRAETLLRESEERYRTTFEQAAVGIVHNSLDGRILFCNERFAQIVGYPPDEVPGMYVSQFTAPEDAAETAALIKRIASGGGGETIEKRYLRKGGSRCWAKTTVSMQHDSQGQPLHMIAFIEDINERKQTEERLTEAQEALRKSEERHRIAFQTSSNAVNIVRMEDDMYLDVNQTFLNMLGYQRDEVDGRTSTELNIWADPGDLQKMDEALRRDHIFRGDVQLRKKNGEIIWGRMSASLFVHDGVSTVLTVTQDISDAKAAEQRLAAAQEALRTSEERYRVAFQTSLDAININRMDDRRYIDCNQAFLDMTGYEREEVLGQTSPQVEIWANPRDRMTMMEMMRQNTNCRGLEIQFRKKSGELFWGEMSASQMEIDGVPCILFITRDLSAAKTAEKTIRSLAFYDPLTGLPNRQHLMARLRQPLDAGTRGGRSQALLLVDLDHFKTLNDTLGHQAGDLLLQEAARRIVACAHEADTVCRLGGDEFVVLLEDQSKVAEEAAAQARAVGEKILAAIDQPCMIEDHECLSTASIGIAVFEDRRDSTDEILQQAEIALYQAKAAGRNNMRFFSPALQAAVNARATLEEDLRQGIKAMQFLLYYQPQVERGRLTGAEALVRWKHPRRGIVLPNDFIPLAEESRLILPLGDWVLEAACKQIAVWAGRKETAHLSVAVNISALQFRQPEFVEQVLETLRRTGANPGNLRLELTESMLVENLEDIIAKMTELRSHGLRFSLDDFGTGYSSLTYLKRLPLDRLKIDRSFVRDMMVDATSGAIAQTILSLGRALGISVIAEGVETEEQRGYLVGLGCHSFQGFLISRPLRLEKFEAFLRGFAEHGGPS